MAINKLVIAGGGTAGWMTALLARRVLDQKIDIELVESDQIGIIGVGEATIPPIQTFNNYVGLDEKEFLRETNATIKLAIRFENWQRQGEQYYHTFGAPGANMGFCTFQHYVTRSQRLGEASDLWEYDLNYLCCVEGKFNKINTQNPFFEVPYAYHFDSALYGQYLRKLAEKSGVRRTEGIIKDILINSENGYIEELQLDNGQKVQGDLFVDCTGLRRLLIGDKLGVGFEDWTHWIPSNSAIAVQTEGSGDLVPYTRSIAHAAGWQWQIPLTHRTGNGIVYSTDHLSDDEAMNTLMTNLPGQPINEPRPIRFRTGRVVDQWHKNVVAIGLSSGFLEPLESTSIHLIQSAAVRLMKLFPNEGIRQATVDRFNEESREEYETVRDFIILHYHVNERDEPYWQTLRHMPIPERLQHKIDLYRETGSIFNDSLDIFRDSSWLQVMAGQGIEAADYHPAADAIAADELLRSLARMRNAKREPMASMLPHREFLERYLASQ
ncbi:MAG: tryptophan 7-halogenase [Pseudomonadales bacterium]|nr:tryptophan 7-halogenase [Pseudomonadales bacterium]